MEKRRKVLERSRKKKDKKESEKSKDKIQFVSQE